MMVVPILTSPRPPAAVPPVREPSPRERLGGSRARWVKVSDLKAPAHRATPTSDLFEAGVRRTSGPASSVQLHSRPGWPKAVLFDNDGVLVDASEAWFKTLSDAARFFGFPPLSWDEFENKYQLSLSKVVDSLELPCHKDELSTFLYANVAPYLGDVRVNADARPMLEALKAGGVRLAVTSNKETIPVMIMLTATGLLPLFEAVVGRDQVANKKPAPDMLYRALTRTGVHPSSAWMVGDAKKDAQACEAAGIRFFGLSVDGGERLEALGELKHWLRASSAPPV